MSSTVGLVAALHTCYLQTLQKLLLKKKETKTREDKKFA